MTAVVARGVRGGRVFARACAAEWTRLWTVRSTWWFLAAGAAVMAGISTIAGVEAASAGGPPGSASAWAGAAVTGLPGQFAVLALALTAVTSDYATGGIVPSLQWTPRRPVFFLARTAVAVAVAAALGALLLSVATLVSFVAASPLLTLAGAGDVVPKVVFAFAAGAAFALGLGFLLRNTAGTLVVVFLLMLVLPLVLPNFGFAWTDAIADALPGSGAAFLLVGEVPGMTTTSSVITLLCWAGGTLLLGWLRLARDDANR